MVLFKEDVSIYGIDSENRVLKRAESIANKAYSEDYYTYQVLADIAHLMEGRYEKQRELETRAENMQLLFESTRGLFNMNKDELAKDCKDMRIETTGNKSQLRHRLLKYYEDKYDY